jgi:hypothetical protein
MVSRLALGLTAKGFSTPSSFKIFSRLSRGSARSEVKNGSNALHFSVSTPNGGGSSQPQQSQLMTHLSQIDIFLDPQTFMPVAFDFNIHPDNNANLDIPVEVQFSNYAQSGGVWVPNTVQEFINSSLALTLQVQSASSLSARGNNNLRQENQA